MRGRRFTLIALLAVASLVLGARVLGPGDLYDKDQPKTMAGSADVALSGNWVWPRDMLREPATKPPLYNWLDVAVLKLTPRWSEWTFKVPTVLATLAIAWIVIRATRAFLREYEHRDVVAYLAAAVWLASIPVMKQSYLSRPDMLMTAFLAGAWVCATRGFKREVARDAARAAGANAEATVARSLPQDSTRAIPPLALTFGLCIAGAALSKGPAALIPIVYLPVAALLLHRKPSLVLRSIWIGAIVLALTIVAVWAWLAYRHAPAAFWGVLSSEGVSRFRPSGSPEGISVGSHLPASWFILKWLPWSLAAGAALLLIGPRQWLRHALAPAIVWVVLVIVSFSFAPGKRADYLLPAYPAASILAAYGMVEASRRARVPVAVASIAPLLFAIYLAQFEVRRSPEAKSGYTRAAVAFADGVRPVVGDEKVVLLVKGYHPLLNLIGRYDGNRARADDLVDGTWVIAPHDPNGRAVVTSGVLPYVVQVAPKQLDPGKIALYRIGEAGGITREAALALLAEQYAWNFPPDRYRASRDSESPATSRPSTAPATGGRGDGTGVGVGVSRGVAFWMTWKP